MTPAEFKTAYPEFDSTSDADIQRQLDTFPLIYSGSYGDLGDYLSGLYTAHQVTVFTSNSGSAPAQTVKSRSIDGMSWTYSNAGESSKAGEFGSTKYGLEFFRLISMFGMGPIMAGASYGHL